MVQPEDEIKRLQELNNRFVARRRLDLGNEASKNKKGGNVKQGGHRRTAAPGKDSKKRSIAKKAGAMGRIKAMINPYKTLKQIDFGKDGLYFVAFLLSIVADLLTLMKGAVEAAPGVGGFAVKVLGLIMGMSANTMIMGFVAVIAFLYLLKGHYKKRRAAMKVAVTMGFGFLELIPVATALPGFVGSFMVNYGLILQERAIEEAERKANKYSKLKLARQGMNTINNYRNKKRLENFAQNNQADDYQQELEKAA